MFAGFSRGYARSTERAQTQLFEAEKTRRAGLREQFTVLAQNAKDPKAREFYIRQLHVLTTTPLTKKLPKGADSIDYTPKQEKAKFSAEPTADDFVQIADMLDGGLGGDDEGMEDGPPPPPQSLGLNLQGAMDRMESGGMDERLPLGMNTGTPIEQPNIPVGDELISRSPIYSSLQKELEAALARKGTVKGMPSLPGEGTAVPLSAPPAPPPALYDAFGGYTREGEMARAQEDAQIKAQNDMAQKKALFDWLSGMTDEERVVAGMVPGVDSPATTRQWKPDLKLAMVGGQPRQVLFDFNSRTFQDAITGERVQPEAFGTPVRVNNEDWVDFYSPDGRSLISRVPAATIRQLGTWERDPINPEEWIFKQNQFGTVGGGGGASAGAPAATAPAPPAPPPTLGAQPGAQPTGAPIPAPPQAIRQPSPYAPQQRGPGRPPASTVVTTPSEQTIQGELKAISTDVAVLSDGAVTLDNLPPQALQYATPEVVLSRFEMLGDDLENNPRSRTMGDIQLKKNDIIDQYVLEAASGNRPIDSWPEKQRVMIAARMAEAGLIQIDVETKAKLMKYSDAVGSLNLLEEHLNRLVNADTTQERLGALIQYETLAAALTRLIGRASGEVGVFTNQDSQDMRAFMAVGMLGAAAIAFNGFGSERVREFAIKLAQERIARVRGRFTEAEKEKFGGPELMDAMRAQIEGASKELAEGSPYYAPSAPSAPSAPPAPPGSTPPPPPSPSASAPTPQAAQPILQRKSKKTGEVQHSLDGGATWVPGPAPQG